MTKAEYKEKSILTTLFQGNSVSYGICLVAALVELWYTLTILDSFVVNFMTGIITFLNITILFVLFTAAVKIKIYKENWALVAFFIGCYALLRAFVIVPLVVDLTQKQTELFVLNIILGVLLIIASILTIGIIKKRDPYLKLKEETK